MASAIRNIGRASTKALLSSDAATPSASPCVLRKETAGRMPAKRAQASAGPGYMRSAAQQKAQIN
jgi:hypothetical protein